MANPNTIPWLHYQDIQIPETAIQQQFQQYYQSGQYSEALTLLENNNTQLQGKAFIADTINKITSGILALEGYYNTGVTLYLSNLATQYFSLVNNLKKMGMWVSSTQYTPYNFVVYNNETYMCYQQPPVGTLPTNTTYWLYLGLRGQQGAPGTNVNMRYNWNATNTYNLNDVVVYDDNMYVALTTNTNVIPTSSSTDWLLFLKIRKGQIYVGTTAPLNPSNNAIWFQTQTDPSQAITTDPIIGQFMRYIDAEATWDEMYPNVLYTWIVDRALYRKQQVELDITIASSQWTGDPATWTYTYAGLDDDSVVNILPASGLNATQVDIYNSLDISITDTTITLTCAITPTADLNIRMVII